MELGNHGNNETISIKKFKNDRFNIQNQVEQLQMKYVGTGHADLTKWFIYFTLHLYLILFFREWGTNIQRDSLASHLGHHSRMAYFSAIENESYQRLKFKFINVY